MGKDITYGDTHHPAMFETASATFVADKADVYPYCCTEFCSALHLEMQGYLLVGP